MTIISRCIMPGPKHTWSEEASNVQISPLSHQNTLMLHAAKCCWCTCCVTCLLLLRNLFPHMVRVNILLISSIWKLSSTIFQLHDSAVFLRSGEKTPAVRAMLSWEMGLINKTWWIHIVESNLQPKYENIFIERDAGIFFLRGLGTQFVSFPWLAHQIVPIHIRCCTGRLM